MLNEKTKEEVMPESKKATIIVHSGGMDKVMSALIIGNGFLSINIPVTIFFTFWGLKALTKNGFKKLSLSKMNILGLGKVMIRAKMKKHNVASLEELAKSFKELGGKIIACTMTMELMGIKKEDLDQTLIDEYGTVGKYCIESKDAQITLFI
ncbi:MAG: NAD(FAD)-dependent dehydrogenase [Spirochaetes bacterium]|nr:MAG: NAD(FAD)-dependent dehydrogenase [Spirochaetota bacterium]